MKLPRLVSLKLQLDPVLEFHYKPSCSEYQDQTKDTLQFITSARHTLHVIWEAVKWHYLCLEFVWWEFWVSVKKCLYYTKCVLRTRYNQWHRTVNYMISVSHSGVDGDSSILGYVAVSTGSKVSDVMWKCSRLTGLQCLSELLELLFLTED
jgi:hypothetical protein